MVFPQKKSEQSFSMFDLPDSPSNLFQLRSSRFKALRFPSCGGMCPVDMQRQGKVVVGVPQNNLACSRTSSTPTHPRVGEQVF